MDKGWSVSHLLLGERYSIHCHELLSAILTLLLRFFAKWNKCGNILSVKLVTVLQKVLSNAFFKNYWQFSQHSQMNPWCHFFVWNVVLFQVHGASSYCLSWRNPSIWVYFHWNVSVCSRRYIHSKYEWCKLHDQFGHTQCKCFKWHKLELGTAKQNK